MKKNVLLAVCGGVAIYKAAYLVRLLIKKGFNVKVMMTDAATNFVQPLLFQTVSNNPVYSDMFKLYEENTEHIALAKWADICAVVPASANTMSKISHGICDNLVTTVIAALPQKTKVVFACAMNSNMWNNPLIQENIDTLKMIEKYILIDPVEGDLACGDKGVGKMAEPEDILAEVEKALKK